MRKRAYRARGISLPVVVLILLAAITTWIGKYRSQPSIVEGITGVVTGRCLRVIDGDTMDIRLRDGTDLRLRLLGVDAMETHNLEKQARQADRLGLPPSTVARLGEEATDRMKSWVERRDVVVVLPPGEKGHDGYGRELGYLEVEGEDVGLKLVSSGLAELRREPHDRSRAYRKAASKN